jgi:hypothetical protein
MATKQANILAVIGVLVIIFIVFGSATAASHA